MHEPGKWGLFSPTQQKNDRSRKKETTETCTYPRNSIGNVAQRNRTPSFFWKLRPIRMEYNLPKKIYLLNETFSQVRHNFYDIIATTYPKRII